MHVEHVEVFPFQTHDHPHGFRVQIDQIAPLELPQGVDPAGHVRAELQVFGEDLHFVHRQVGDQDDSVVFHADHQSGVALVPPGENLHVVPHLEELLQLGRLKHQRLLQVLVFRHYRDHGPVDADDLALEVDQFALAHFHVVAGAERVGHRFVLLLRRQLQIDSFRLLLEPLQLGQCRLDPVDDDGAQGEVLVEKTLARVPVPFEDEEVAVGGHLASDGTDRFRIKRLARWPTFLLPFLRLRFLQLSITLQLSNFLESYRLSRPQRPPQSRVVDPREQLQVDLVLSHVEIIHLRDVVLVQSSLQAHPLLRFQTCLFFDNSQNVRHFFDRHHLLLPNPHSQVTDIFYRRLDVGLLVRLDVDVPFDTLRCHHRLDLQRLIRILVRQVFAHQQQSRRFFFADSALDHPQIGISAQNNCDSRQTPIGTTYLTPGRSVCCVISSDISSPPSPKCLAAALSSAYFFLKYSSISCSFCALERIAFDRKSKRGVRYSLPEVGASPSSFDLPGCRPKFVHFVRHDSDFLGAFLPFVFVFDLIIDFRLVDDETTVPVLLLLLFGATGVTLVLLAVVLVEGVTFRFLLVLYFFLLGNFACFRT
jgi:hypothetical protein